jgi:hypothetical protein
MHKESAVHGQQVFYTLDAQKENQSQLETKATNIACLINSVKVSENNIGYYDSCYRFSNSGIYLLPCNASAFAKHFHNAHSFTCANSLAHTNLYLFRRYHAKANYKPNLAADSYANAFSVINNCTFVHKFAHPYTDTTSDSYSNTNSHPDH